MSCFNIPIDLEINILERLPVKTLVTITAVCKSWYSIIKNPHMLKRYHGLSLASITDHEREGRALLIYRELTNDSEDDCVVISHDSFVVRETFALNPLSDDWSNLKSVGGCCNGVICMSEDIRYVKKLYLVNPSIRKLRPLPSSSTENRIDEWGTKGGHKVGFGYDEITDDYKVVKVYRIYEDIASIDVKFEAEVYSLRNDNWKTVEANDHRYYLKGRCVSVNNATHWLSSVNHRHLLEMIVAFDFSSEVFREIKLPFDSTYGISLALYKGSLALLVIEAVNEVVDESEEGQEYTVAVTVSLWIMEEYGVKESWSKVFTWVIHRLFEEAVNLTNNGKLIFRKTDAELAIWDPETEQVVDLVGFLDDDYSTIEDYFESLVLI